MGDYRVDFNPNNAFGWTREQYAAIMKEITDVAEADRAFERRHNFINNPEAWYDGQVIGRIDTLPDWAQLYIRTLRQDHLWLEEELLKLQKP